MPACRSSRRGFFLAAASPFLGRPRLRGAVAGAGCTFSGALPHDALLERLTGLSRASIAVASREMCPTKRSLWVYRMSASCTRAGRLLALNSAKARENVLSLGNPRLLSQPHKRRSTASAASRSMSAKVVGRFSTAFATNARARAWRSAGGRPGNPGQGHLHKGLNARDIQHCHEPLMLRSERPNFFPQHREKKTLNVDPTRWLASPACPRLDSDGDLLQKHHAQLGPRAPHVAPSKRQIQRAAAILQLAHPRPCRQLRKVCQATPDQKSCWAFRTVVSLRDSQITFSLIHELSAMGRPTDATLRLARRPMDKDQGLSAGAGGPCWRHGGGQPLVCRCHHLSIPNRHSGLAPFSWRGLVLGQCS